MRIGIPRESKDMEYRVGLVPSGARQLVGHGHELIVESGAGLGSGFDNDAYAEAGARICSPRPCAERRQALTLARCFGTMIRNVNVGAGEIRADAGLRPTGRPEPGGPGEIS